VRGSCVPASAIIDVDRLIFVTGSDLPSRREEGEGSESDLGRLIVVEVSGGDDLVP